MIEAKALNNEVRDGVETEVAIGDCSDVTMGMEALAIIVAIVNAVKEKNPLIGEVTRKYLMTEECWERVKGEEDFDSLRN